MKNVLDVSAAFAIIIGAPASRHFLPEVESATQVLAPDLFYSEATNAAWKFHHIEELSPGESLKLAERAIQLVDIFIPSETLWKEAFELACKLAHLTYDCYYLVLAQQQKATLLTTDKRVIKIAKALGIPTIGPDGPVS
jgi:predicted nucleic acid-binding protein